MTWLSITMLESAAAVRPQCFSGHFLVVFFTGGRVGSQVFPLQGPESSPRSDPPPLFLPAQDPPFINCAALLASTRCPQQKNMLSRLSGVRMWEGGGAGEGGLGAEGGWGGGESEPSLPEGVCLSCVEGEVRWRGGSQWTRGVDS